MLDLLLPGFDTHVANMPDAVESCLAHEVSAITDIPFLEKHVTGVADYEWDYSALGVGFMDMMAPYLALRPRSSDLQARVLSELTDSDDTERLLPGILLIEFPQLGNYVNDTYILHSDLTPKEPPPRVASKLTQMRYAGQYLTKYPAYLLVDNHLDLDPVAMGAAQKLGASTYVISGIGRSQFVYWMRHDFAGVTLPNYYQTALNNLHGMVVAPAQMAAIMADMPEADIARLQRGLGYLSVALKLDAERRYLTGDLDFPPEPEAAGTATLVYFPGYALLSRQLPIDCGGTVDRYPDAHAVFAKATEQARAVLDDALIAEMTGVIDENLDKYRAEMAAVPALCKTAAAIDSCLEATR